MNAAKLGLIAAWLVVVFVTMIVTRFSLKALFGLIVVGAIGLAVVNNYTAVKQGGDNTIKEIQSGTTTGLGSPWPPSSARPVLAAAPAAARGAAAGWAGRPAAVSRR